MSLAQKTPTADLRCVEDARHRLRQGRTRDSMCCGIEIAYSQWIDRRNGRKIDKRRACPFGNLLRDALQTEGFQSTAREDISEKTPALMIGTGDTSKSRDARLSGPQSDLTISPARRTDRSHALLRSDHRGPLRAPDAPPRSHSTPAPGPGPCPYATLRYDAGA